MPIPAIPQIVLHSAIDNMDTAARVIWTEIMNRKISDGPHALSLLAIHDSLTKGINTLLEIDRVQEGK